MRPILYELGPYGAADAVAIAVAQQAVANQSLALVGVAGDVNDPFLQDVPRTVLLTFVAGNLSAAVAEDGGAFVDETAEANSAAANDMTLFPAVPVAGVDRYNFGSDARFPSIDVNVGTVGTGTYTVIWEYWNGSVWGPLGALADGTTNFKTGGTNTVSFGIPTDWATLTINGQGPFFYIRAEIQAGTVTAVPVGTQAFVAGAATGNRFVIHGAGHKGNEIYESITGGATTAESAGVFSKIYSITPENNLGGDVTAGTVDAVPTPWVPLNYIVPDFNATIRLQVIGTVVTGALLQSTIDQLGFNNRDPIRGGHHGSVFDIVNPIVSIDDITNEVLGAATVITDTALQGQLPRPVTAVRALSQEAIGAGELLRLQVLQGIYGR